jgi:hypothetical protein
MFKKIQKSLDLSVDRWKHPYYNSNPHHPGSLDGCPGLFPGAYYCNARKTGNNIPNFPEYLRSVGFSKNLT